MLGDITCVPDSSSYSLCYNLSVSRGLCSGEASDRQSQSPDQLRHGFAPSRVPYTRCFPAYRSLFDF